jgi:hypothetical protein
MKIAIVMSSIVVAAVFAAPHAGHCKQVSLQSQGKVKGGCGGGGDVYFPKNSTGVYGCMKQDGSGIVCGGSGKYAKRCDTFIKVPPTLPSRSAIQNAEKAQPVQ